MSNTFLTKKFHNELSTTAQHINAFSASEKITQDNWGALCTDAEKSGASNKQEWADFLRPFESELLQKASDAGVDVLGKSGRWKGKPVITKGFVSKKAYSTYRSNKSVIGAALEKGIALRNPNTGEFMGKTAIEKLCKEPLPAKGTPAYHLSCEQKMARAFKTMTELWGEVASETRDKIKREMSTWAT